MAIQIVLGGYGPPTTTHSRAIKLMGDRISGEFGARVDIKYVWNVMDFGYKAEEVLWLSERGIMTIAYQSTSYLTERVPELEFADLPFLFAGLDEARAAMDDKLGAWMSRSIEARVPGYKMLGYFSLVGLLRLHTLLGASPCAPRPDARRLPPRAGGGGPARRA